jgi:hypothetical protein
MSYELLFIIDMEASTLSFCFSFSCDEGRGGNQSEGLAHLEYCAEMHRVDGAGAQAAADRGYLPCQWLSKGISFLKYLRKLFCGVSWAHAGW